MQWIVAIVAAALIVGLWLDHWEFRRPALVATIAAVLALWFTQMKA